MPWRKRCTVCFLKNSNFYCSNIFRIANFLELSNEGKALSETNRGLKILLIKNSQFKKENLLLNKQKVKLMIFLIELFMKSLTLTFILHVDTFSSKIC